MNTPKPSASWATLAASAWIVAATITGCSPPPLEGPPEVRLGRVECAECGMLISEDRCSSALLIEREGVREHLNYDDLGCMLDDERDGLDGATVVDRFARDYESRTWVRADAATFLFSEDKSLHTPMGSGIVAFSTRSVAEAARGKHAGTFHDYASLQDARRAWMEARFGKPKGADAAGTPSAATPRR